MTRPDLVVVGAGPAGLACAITAAERGARVLLLDKDERIGGALHYSGGHLSAAGTPRQAERGIVDDVDAHYADIRRISRDTHRDRLTRLAVELAPATLAWLDEQGFEYDETTPRLVYGHETYSTPRTVHGTRMALSVLDVLTPLLQRQIDAGFVQVQLGVRADRLLVADGRVTGVGAGAQEFTASTTVLATGGFGHDEALFAELEGVPLVTSAAPGSTGDGLRMARAIGAGLQGLGHYIPTFGGLPPAGGDLRVDWVHRPHLLAPERDPWEIYVAADGRRWINEDEPSIDRKERLLMTVPAMTFWTVFDARALRESTPMINNCTPEQVDALAGVRRGIHRADTLAELARLAGIDPAGLTDEVARYNRFVSDGVDADFGRTAMPAPIAEPPFYAIENHPVTLITFTGVDTDDELRVRRDDGSVIDGVYAVGELIGAAVFNGNSFCSGMMLTPALALGRLLGERLAAADQED
jgi:fumarate reductase flavoprotein subunit